MRQVELVLGKVYYCDASSRWQDYGHSLKYVLRDSRLKWSLMHGYYNDHQDYKKTLEDGTSVMLDGSIHDHGGKGVLMYCAQSDFYKWRVFPLGAIRGEYDATVALVKETKAARNKIQAEADAIYRRNRLSVENSKTVLIGMGLPEAYKLSPVSRGCSDEVKVEMSWTQLEWIVCQMVALSVKGE